MCIRDRAYLSSEWQLLMNTSSGAFNIKGEMEPMNAVVLNPLIEPLGMASVKAGQVDTVTFNMDGSNTKADATVLFLYRDLKLEILKKDEDEKQLKKKGLASAL